jgi:hypothetical protein
MGEKMSISDVLEKVERPKGSKITTIEDPIGIRECRVCGCTDTDCSDCIVDQGYPCYWVEYDLCSRCFDGPTS